MQIAGRSCRGFGPSPNRPNSGACDATPLGSPTTTDSSPIPFRRNRGGRSTTSGPQRRLRPTSTVPYRFYLQYIVGAESSLESDRPDRSQWRIHGDLVRRVLAAWAQKFDRNNPENAWLDYADEPSNMASVARDILDAAQDAGALGPPAGTRRLRTEIEGDLDRCRRREVIVAREGWRPVEVNFAFHDATLKVTGHRTLRLRGAIDRIDRHPSGHHRAIRFFTDEAIPDVHGFVNGSSFESIVALAGLNQYGINVGQAEVQHCAVTCRGHFESQLLQGESLTSKLSSGSSTPP